MYTCSPHRLFSVLIRKVSPALRVPLISVYVLCERERERDRGNYKIKNVRRDREREEDRLKKIKISQLRKRKRSGKIFLNSPGVWVKKKKNQKPKNIVFGSHLCISLQQLLLRATKSFFSIFFFSRKRERERGFFFRLLSHFASLSLRRRDRERYHARATGKRVDVE